MNIAIETKSLKLSYGKRQILKGIDLQVPEGGIYGYLGQNGAGKTSTIKLLLGLIRQTGAVYYQGKDLNTYRKCILSKVGAIVEKPNYYNLTAMENLKCLDNIYKCGTSRIKAVLQMVGLSQYANVHVDKFSYGMKQRLAISMAILHDPSVLILDEPMKGLDPEGIHDLRELILQLHNQGKTIFLSSHILGEMEKVCTHIGVLHEGKLLFQGSIHELLHSLPSKYLLTCDDSQKLYTLCKDKFTITLLSKNHLTVELGRQQMLDELLHDIMLSQTLVYRIENETASLETVYLNLIHSHE